MTTMRIFFDGPEDTGSWFLQLDQGIFKYQFPGSVDESFAAVQEFAAQMVAGQAEAAGWASNHLIPLGYISSQENSATTWQTLFKAADSLEYDGDLFYEVSESEEVGSSLWDLIVEAGTELAAILA